MEVETTTPLESTKLEEPVQPQLGSAPMEDGKPEAPRIGIHIEPAVKKEVKEEPKEPVNPTTEPALNIENPMTVTPIQDMQTYYREEDVSDDDYTNDYSEVSVKRRKRNPRVGFSTTSPILKGQYVMNENTCVWEGKWGMGMNGEINGLTSDFKYTLTLPEGTVPPTSPQNGKYNGFFWMKLTPPKRIPENDLVIEFTLDGNIYRVSGHGENKLGAFSLEGSYNPITMEMVCSKIYAPTGGLVRSRSSRGREEYPEKEYRSIPRQATPSFLRESIDVPVGLNEDMKMCYKSLKRLMNHKWAGPFSQPVDPVALNIPDYFSIIKEPMDFSTIQKNIEEKKLVSKEEFASSVRRVFENAFLYNKPEDDVTIMAKTLSSLFEKDYMQITRRIFESEPEPSSPVYTNKMMKRSAPSMGRSKHRNAKPIKPIKNTKVKRVGTGGHGGNSFVPQQYEDMMSQMVMLQNKVKMMEKQIQTMKTEGDEGDVDDIRPMTVEEKKDLSMEINQLVGDKLQSIVEIIESSASIDSHGSEEIEIDLDTLPNETLRKLQDFVKKCKSDGTVHKNKSPMLSSTNPLMTGNTSYVEYNSDSENSVNGDYF